jgi:hypothetical protein
MTAYEAGFDAGERASFADRQRGVRLPRPERPRGAYQQGFWDGYCPRNQSWALRRNVQPEGWWHERESEKTLCK